MHTKNPRPSQRNSCTLVAIHTSNDERGRAFAAHFAITHAWWLIAYPVTGRLASSVGPQMTFTLCGVACAVITAIAWWIGEGIHGQKQGMKLA
jgi:hypothetical protein